MKTMIALATTALLLSPVLALASQASTPNPAATTGAAATQGSTSNTDPTKKKHQAPATGQGTQGSTTRQPASPPANPAPKP